VATQAVHLLFNQMQQRQQLLDASVDFLKRGVSPVFIG
jgi:hypothetical protein